MKIEYDKIADALYIRFQPGKVEKSTKIQDGIILDIAADGNIFGLEILEVSRRIPASELASLDANLPLRKAS